MSDNVSELPGAARMPQPKVVVHQPRPRFVIEKLADWRNEWVVMEYAPDLKTATRRLDTLMRTNDCEMRILDREELL